MNRVSWICLVATGAFAGCGGGDGNGGDDVPVVGTFEVVVTDAPVDDADAVLVAIKQFEVKPAGGDSFRVPLFDASPVSGLQELDLVELADGQTDLLVISDRFPAGEYEWMRAYFDESASYIRLKSDGTTYPLVIPNGGTGVTLDSGFTVPVQDTLTLILDFNLRSSVIELPDQAGPNGELRRFELRPAVRVMNFRETGGVEGTVDPSLIDVNNARCFVADPPLSGNAVYVFEGTDAELDDVSASEVDGAAPPLTSDVVEFDVTDGAFEYHLMFLPQGGYTLAFTCSAMADGAGDDDYLPTTESDFDFDATINVEVIAREDKRCAIPSQDDTC